METSLGPDAAGLTGCLNLAVYLRPEFCGDNKCQRIILFKRIHLMVKANQQARSFLNDFMANMVIQGIFPC